MAAFIWDLVLLRGNTVCKFGSFKNPFALINGPSELYFKFRRLILLVQTKNVIPMNYCSSTWSWEPWRWVRLDLILMIRDMYINPNWTHSQSSLVAAEAPSLKISSQWNISQMITKTVQISTRIFIFYVMKRGIQVWVWWKVNGNWDKNMIRISQWRESHCRKYVCMYTKIYILVWGSCIVEG